MRRFPRTVAVALLSALYLNAQATSREEQIRQQQVDKRARLWPENTPGLVRQLNKYTERGLLEGVRSGQGSNGFQFVLGGMRSGNGFTAGVGYRRIDLWGERLGFRATARGTIQRAYMFDLEMNSPRLTYSRVDLSLYAKFENSPAVDYYGPGPNSNKNDRTSYRLEDTGIDGRIKVRAWRQLFVGGSLGIYMPNTGPGQRDGYPSTEEKFPPAVTPGISSQPKFLRYSGELQYDYRDLPSGPRSGGNYLARWYQYRENDLNRHDFHTIEVMAQQYIPYYNKTRVIALHFDAIGSFAETGQTVPFYLEPTLGGNDRLRGFARYRFYGQSALLTSVEHRWHIFSAGHASIFFDMGKVANKTSQLNYHGLEYSGGIGLRFTIHNAVIMRIDNAFSREGYRFMWTFSNPW